MSKTCKHCHQEKDESEFYTITQKKTGKVYLKSYCKPCGVIKAREYYQDKIATTDKSRTRNKSTDRAVANKILGNMKKRCQQKGWEDPEFSVDEIELAIKDKACAVTGIKFQNTLVLDKGVWNGFIASPDRIDNNKGYTKDNVQWVISLYNVTKGNFPTEQIETFIKEYYEHIS